MPLPVNNVEVKQQLNDQTHYSRQQIKARKDSDVVFTPCVLVCKCWMNLVVGSCISHTFESPFACIGVIEKVAFWERSNQN